MDERSFHVGDVLSVTAGLLLSPRHMDGVYDILNFLTGDNLWTHQLPRACSAAGPWLLEKYPALRAPTDEAREAAKRDDWMVAHQQWLIDAAVRHGSHFTIEPMPPGSWLRVDPVKEAQAMVGEERVIVATVEPAP